MVAVSLFKMDVFMRAISGRMIGRGLPKNKKVVFGGPRWLD
jgi:hypothetical protein